MMNFLMATPVNIQNPDDVMLNQRGEISAAQNARLNASLGFQSGCVGLIFGLFFIPFVVVFVSFAIDAMTEALIFGLVILAVLLIAGIGMLSQAGWLLTAFQRWNALKRDRENRAIRQGQGQLVFRKNTYAVQAAGRDLLLPTSTNAGGLKPGATYRFYYLEESGFVLSAEELFPASPAQARSAMLEILATANNFSMEELELNRNNEVSPAQRSKALPGMLFGLVLGFVPLVFGLLMIQGLMESEDGLIGLLIPGIFLAVFGLVGGYMFVSGLLDLFAQAPLVTEGEGRKEKRTSGGKNRRTTYYYVVDGTSFQVKKSAYEALVDGERYRVYALPRTKKLLTIEPL